MKVSNLPSELRKHDIYLGVAVRVGVGCDTALVRGV
jgi:hypothetical protein